MRFSSTRRAVTRVAGTFDGQSEHVEAYADVAN